MKKDTKHLEMILNHAKNKSKDEATEEDIHSVTEKIKKAFEGHANVDIDKIIKENN